MKTTLQILAVTLTLGALTQTIYSYAYEARALSIEEEENSLIQLMELNRTKNTESFISKDVHTDSVVPAINGDDELKEAIVQHSLRYIQAIGGEKALLKIIATPEFETLRARDPFI